MLSVELDLNERQDTTESEIDLLLAESHDDLDEEINTRANNMKVKRLSVPH